MPRRKRNRKSVQKPSLVQTTKGNSFETLAEELVYLTFSFLSLSGLIASMRVNKRLRIIAQDDVLWRKMLAKHFPYVLNQLQAQDAAIAVFKAKFMATFDPAYFPELTQKQNITHALNGDIAAIQSSSESDTTRMSLFASMIASGQTFDLSLLDQSGEVNALYRAGKNVNHNALAFVRDNASHMNRSTFALVVKAFVHMGNISVLRAFFENQAAQHFFVQNALLYSMEKWEEEDPITQAILSILNTNNESIHLIQSTIFSSQEAAKSGKCFKILNLTDNDNMITQTKVKLVPSEDALKEISDDSESSALLEIAESDPLAEKQIAKIAIDNGYIELLKKYIAIREEWVLREVLSLKTTVNQQIILNVLFEKVLMRAIKKGLYNEIESLVTKKDVPVKLIAAAFDYAIYKPDLEIVQILLKNAKWLAEDLIQSSTNATEASPEITQIASGSDHIIELSDLLATIHLSEDEDQTNIKFFEDDEEDIQDLSTPLAFAKAFEHYKSRHPLSFRDKFSLTDEQIEHDQNPNSHHTLTPH